MSEPRVIQADFANWRPVSGRKVLQLVFEVPIEQTADVMEKLGVPMPGESKWCAVALLEKPVEKPWTIPVDEGFSNPAKRIQPKAEAQKERTPFNQLPLSQQCAIRCGDFHFRQFLIDEHGLGMPHDDADVILLVRHICDVSTRSLLDSPEHAHKWHDLEKQFQVHKTTTRYADSVR